MKAEVENWLTTLKKCGVANDWMVILVEAPELRKGANKLLPRTSIIDKLKMDVAGRQPDRCFALIGELFKAEYHELCKLMSNLLRLTSDPSKSDSKAAESWQTLLHRMRLLLLLAYNRTLGR